MRASRILGLSATLALCHLPGCSGSSDKGSDGGIGKACNPADSTCREGLECSATRADPEKFQCTIRTGATCDPERSNGGCADAAICVSAEPEPGAASAGASGESEGEMLCLLGASAECEPSSALCAPEFTCAPMATGGNRCFHRVVLEGRVADSSTNDGISGGQVIAIDEEGVAVTDVALSADDGGYSLEVPVERNEDGSPVSAFFRLRGAAQDYQTFPSGIRVALPIDVSTAIAGDDAYIIENSLTELALVPLPAAERTTISGTVTSLSDSSNPIGGVLVVATADSGAFSALTDSSGHFTVFNVPHGSYELRGYAAGLPLGTASVSVSGAAVDGVELSELADDTTTVTGNVQIVNAPGGSLTSVILVVEDTFNAAAATGEVPRGLRAPRTGAPDVSGDFVIAGVPEGNYIVLAAYENDDLVRDPDTNIAGTDFVRLEVGAATAAEVAIPDSFKVTEALAVISPGATEAEAVQSAPTLTWADDSSEDWYEVRVFDALGNEVWSVPELPGVSGGSDVSVDYEGPLDPGMVYQFRVTSWRQPGNGGASPISRTEDLRGVFYLPAE